MQKKGQAATELLIILAVSIVVLITIYSYSSDTITGLNKEQLVKTAQMSVQDLANAANDVYIQGVGAKKRVFYTIPNNVDQSKSGIEENSFVINVLGTDVYASANTCLLGELSTEQGGRFVWLTAQEECVFVGIENLEINKTSSYVTLNQDETTTDTITITNNSEETAEVFLIRNWTHYGDVDLNLDTYSFSLNEAESQEVVLTYISSLAATGSYTGTVSINAWFESGDENTSLPATAEIVVPDTDLLLFPATYSATLIGGDIQTIDLNVCNNSDNTLTNIYFIDSGDISTWIDEISIISSLAIGTCVTTSFTITVPASQTFGTHTGIITATDNENNIDLIEITITIPAASDSFVLDWTNSQVTPNRKRLWGWGIENTGIYEIIIDKMTISWFNDLDGATLEEIRLDSDIVWDTGGAISGQEIDISDFTLDASTSYPSNNRLEFSSGINNDSEVFQIVFTFTDGSTYTSALYQP